MKKSGILITVIFFVVLGVYFISKQQTPANAPLEQDPIAEQILEQVPTWLPEASWGEITQETEETPYGSLSGQSRTGTLSTDSPMINHFDNSSYLQSLGFIPDQSLLADGPAASSWGYKRHSNGDIQIVIVSYKTNPTNASANEPVEFDCPCTAEASVFVSNPFVPQNK